MPKKVKQGKIVLTHGQLKKLVVDYLRYNKWLVIPVAMGAFSYRGIADLYIIRRGFQVWIEIKTGKDIQSEYQGRFAADILNQGGRYLLVRSLDDLESYMSHEDKNRG